MAALYRSPAAAAEVRRWCADGLRVWSTPHEDLVLPTSLGPTHLVALGGGPRTCLYLAGTNFNAATSTTILDALAATGRTVVCADLPGQPGLSAAGRPVDEERAYAAWLHEVIGHVGRRSGGGAPVVVGHSRGAAVALTADPSVVAGLVLVDPAGLARVRIGLRMLAATVAWLARPDAARARAVVAGMRGSRTVTSESDPIVEWMALVARCTRTTGAPGPLPADVVGRWRGRPVRVAVGAEDVFFPPPALARASRAWLGVDPTVLPGVGHLSVDEDPEGVAALVDGLPRFGRE